jgi:hypothetical protein
VTTAQHDQQAEGTPHIYTAIRNVMDKVRGVPKAGEFKRSGRAEPDYKFQKYDDMAAAIGGAFRDEGVMIQAKVLDVIVDSWDKSSQSGLQRWCRVIIKKRFLFTSLVDGTTLEIEACGEGFDNSDKTSNKAETGAIKNAFKQAFVLATGEEDPDEVRPDDTGRPVERVINDPWVEAERAVHQAANLAATTGQPQREWPAKAVEMANKGLASISQCRTTGDLDKLLSWAMHWKILPVPVDGGVPLGARLIAAKATLPVGPPLPSEADLRAAGQPAANREHYAPSHEGTYHDPVSDRDA